MVDTVTTNILEQNDRYAVFKFTNESDGTGEVAVVKVDLSTLIGSDGKVPENVACESIRYDVSGFNYVVMAWDRTASDEPMQVMRGNGYEDYRPLSYLQDPGRGTAGTGNIILTTDGGADGSSYDITLKLKLRDRV